MSITLTIQDGNERLTNYGGLALIGALLDTTRITERVAGIHLPTCATPKISHGDIIASMTGLLSLGLPSFAAIEQFRGDPFFAQSLGLDTCPSESILRQRLDGVETAFDVILKEESARLLRHRMPSLGLLTTSEGVSKGFLCSG